MTHRASVDFPHPVSPTRASVSPRRTSRLTSLTACTLSRDRVNEAAALHREFLHDVLERDQRLAGARRDAARRSGVPHGAPARGQVVRGAGHGVSGGVSWHSDRPPRGIEGETGSPAGRAIRLGGWPGIGVRRPPARSARGIACSSPRVYGWLGAGTDRARGATSIARPAYITITSSATSATMPRSCVIRMIAVPNSCCTRPKEPDDLRLHGHVECGRRLVGDEQRGVGARAPSRSSRAAASRRRTGADSRRRGDQDAGCRPVPGARSRGARACAVRHLLVRLNHLDDLPSDRDSSGWRLERGFWNTIAMPRPRTARNWSWTTSRAGSAPRTAPRR